MLYHENVNISLCMHTHPRSRFATIDMIAQKNHSYYPHNFKHVGQDVDRTWKRERLGWDSKLSPIGNQHFNPKPLHGIIFECIYRHVHIYRHICTYEHICKDIHLSLTDPEVPVSLLIRGGARIQTKESEINNTYNINFNSSKNEMHSYCSQESCPRWVLIFWK